MGEKLSVHINRNQKFVELFIKIGDFAKICDSRSFYDHPQNIWSMITHNHDWQKLKLLQSIIISMNKYWFEIYRHKWWASVVYKFRFSHLGSAHNSTLV